MRRLVPVAIGLASILLLNDVSTAYLLSGHYWPTASVTFYVNPANHDMSQQAAIATLQAAAANWSEQSTANIRFVYAGTTSGSSLVNNGKNEVFFRNASNGSVAGATYYWYGMDGKSSTRQVKRHRPPRLSRSEAKRMSAWTWSS